MKRWLIIVLTVLLPLQTVFAAAHTCGSGQQAAAWALHDGVQDASHDHNHPNADGSGPPCAACAHHCHAQPATFNVASDAPRFSPPTHDLAVNPRFNLPAGVFSRIERPKWRLSA